MTYLVYAIGFELLAICLIECFVVPEVRYHRNTDLMERIAKDHENQDKKEGRD